MGDSKREMRSGGDPLEDGEGLGAPGSPSGRGDAPGPSADESDIRYRTLFDASIDSIFIETLEGNILDCNTTATRVFGYTKDELTSMNVADIAPPDALRGYRRDLLPKTLEGGAFFEAENIRKGGEVFPVEINMRAAEIDGEKRLIVVVRDITDRKRAEAERQDIEARLRQQQKLEAIGTLASGVAHEINNPINIVMNYAELIGRRGGSDATTKEYAGEIVRESQRIATIVRNLLAFSRQDREGHSPARMVDIVETTLSLIKKVLEKDQVLVSVDVPEELPRVRCRSQQIQQVLMNLLTNARDALNERYPSYDEQKRVVITSRTLEEEGRRWIRTTVADQGPGIPAQVIERIFDPFFTLKPRDQGTGLGLSVSHGIATEHGGRLLVESQPGEGARFHVDLPLVD